MKIIQIQPPYDYAEARKWYRRAAERGDTSAQYRLGTMYEDGEGVPQDYAEARKWYRLAAEQGAAYAQSSLGEMYAGGRGVPQDYVRAHFWLNLATAAHRHHWAYRKRRDEIAEHMTPAQIAEAQKLAREWMEKHGQ